MGAQLGGEEVVIYQGKQLVLVAEDRQGCLMSIAAPSPSGFPKHLFINAQARFSAAEDQIGSLLNQVDGFDAYLDILQKNGFNNFSADTELELGEIETGFEIIANGVTVAAMHNQSDQFMRLHIQPEAGKLHSKCATMTAYDEANKAELQSIFVNAVRIDDLQDAILQRSYFLSKI